MIDQLRLFPFAFLALCFVFGTIRSADAETCVDVAPVWSGHPVGFSLLTTPERQYVGYYDAKRRLTVASRKLTDTTWRFAVLPETLGWDSHNYITMALDDSGDIHLFANMHSSPLVYFRTAKPGDIRSFRRIASMVGRDEARCTYPQFFRGPHREFIFTYRSGGSGNGDQYYNVYDHRTKTWKRLLDEPLTSGEDKCNAYFSGLRMYEDGYYHLAWVWRDTPDCSSNHDVSHARSKDLVHWETSIGKPLKLPITPETAEIVDPVPPKGGTINGDLAIGFDSKKRLVISYMKYDARGNNQIYNARLEDGRWKVYQVSDWDYRWEFSGGGSIPFEIGLGPVVVEKDGRLSQAYRHIKYGNGKWILDEDTLKPTEDIPSTSSPKVAVEPSALQARSAGDAGSSGEPGVRYVLRWETLGPNRDKPREGTPPPPSMLKLCRIETPAQ